MLASKFWWSRAKEDLQLSLGGLDNWDQSRSRFLDLSRSTFETCQDYPLCWDQNFYFSVKIFKIKTFQLRLICIKIFIEIVKINWDCQDFSRFIKISQHFFSPGGLDLSRSRLSISTLAESQSRQLRKSWHWQSASLDNRENLDTFKKLVSTIEISRFSLDGHMQIQYFSVEIETYWDLSRLLWLFVIFVDFSIFFSIKK
jgi:hypothetical protein